MCCSGLRPASNAVLTCCSSRAMYLVRALAAAVGGLGKAADSAASTFGSGVIFIIGIAALFWSQSYIVEISRCVTFFLMCDFSKSHTLIVRDLQVVRWCNPCLDEVAKPVPVLLLFASEMPPAEAPWRLAFLTARAGASLPLARPLFEVGN